MDRVILHSDLNNFYVSVECLYNPELKDKPVAVCGSQSTRHGIVLAKNYIAKKFGVKTGEAIWEAHGKCPGLVVVPPNYSLYLKFSCLPTEIYRSYTDKVEPFGIDECWLDVTDSVKLFGSGVDIAQKIRQRIKTELGVTASVGVSFNKIFAKLGSDMKKPDGLVVISSEEAAGFIETLPVDKVPGVGLVSGMVLSKMGIKTLGDVKKYGQSVLVRRLGKFGTRLFELASGIDRSGVEPVRTVKSVSSEKTLEADTRDKEYLKTYLLEQAEDVGSQLRQKQLRAKTVFIKIKHSDFTQITRQASLEKRSNSAEMLYKSATALLDSYNLDRPVRLIGLGATDLVDADIPVQQELFPENPGQWEKWEKVESALDTIRRKYGTQKISRAAGRRERGRPPEKGGK